MGLSEIDQLELIQIDIQAIIMQNQLIKIKKMICNQMLKERKADKLKTVIILQIIII